MAMQNDKSGVLAVLYVATINVVKGDTLGDRNRGHYSGIEAEGSLVWNLYLICG